MKKVDAEAVYADQENTWRFMRRISLKYGNYEFNLKTNQNLRRVYDLSPKDGERYYFRLQLTQITGKMSFEDLHTFDNVVNES